MGAREFAFPISSLIRCHWRWFFENYWPNQIGIPQNGEAPPFPMAEEYMGHGSAPPLTMCHSPKALPEHCSQSERRNECFLHPVLRLVFAWEESQRMRKTRFQYLNLNGLINTTKNYCFLKENSQYKPRVAQEASRNQKRSNKEPGLWLVTIHLQSAIYGHCLRSKPSVYNERRR